MNKECKRVVLISASPKVSENSTSGVLTAILSQTMAAAGLCVSRVDVRKSLLKGQSEADFEQMLHADALVFTFPLYIFCLPGLLIRFLQDYYAFWLKRTDKEWDTRVYAIVNCGFPEAEINLEAVRVIQSFSSKTNNMFRFGVMIGGGGMIPEVKDAPFMRKTMARLSDAFKLMAEDVKNSAASPVENISVKVSCPRRLYYFMGNWGWIQTAKKNGLKKKELYQKPYSTDLQTSGTKFTRLLRL